MSSWKNFKVALSIVVSIWLLCFILILPVVILSGVVKNFKNNTNYLEFNFTESSMNYSTKSVCTIEWPENKHFPSDLLYVIYSIIFSFLIPFIIISVFYVKIIKFLKSRVEFRRSANVSNSGDINRKVTILVLSIISVYLLCFTPFWINQIVLVTYFTVSSNQSQYFYNISSFLSSMFQILISLNSALNPFLYAFISEKFREEFKNSFSFLIGKLLLKKLNYRCVKKSAKE